MVPMRGAGFSFLLVFGSTLVACSSSERRPDEPIVADLHPGEEVVCRRQRPIGSHIPVEVCRTRAEIEAAQEAASRAVGPLRTMSGDSRRMSGDDPIASPR